MNNQIIRWLSIDRPIREITMNGQKWYSLEDICCNLGFPTEKTVVDLLDEEDVKIAQITNDIGLVQKINVINEPGVYSALLQSDKLEAKAFRRWITHKLIPSEISHRKIEQEIMAKKLSEKIKAYTEQGHSLRHIASLTGFSSTTIFRFLRRKKLPSIKTATHIIDIISSNLGENEH